ncbi:MAG TPA: RagB/SusD family nutrient uptake outer membrane protein [Prolixibacteraceae bacterium]|nr:RagB/SusD family nutrient uptake outer membrane protein [Prolixibacteraceae bacterium]
MKNLIILACLFVGVYSLSSCSKDYLDTKPTAETATNTIFETTDNAALAINGINKLMTMQYLGSQGFNGEGTIKMYYGNYPGNNFFVNLASWSVIINSDYHENISSIYLYYPWYYYYMIIGNANSITENIDNAKGIEADKQFIKAQALTFRAYSFLMLSQLYCKRWSDSNGGASQGLVLRTDISTGDQALSTLKETYDQIYKDLDDAIALYTSSGKTRSKNYDPDKNVAYAVYARAALTRQDYTKAAAMAVSARTGYPLMNNTEYKAGFYSPNKEWIWSSYGASDETLYFFSYFSYIAYNSSASAVRTYPKCISKELFTKIPATDVRRSLFLDPTGYTYTTSTGVASSALKARAFTLFPNLYSTASAYAYMQFKIGAADLPGVGNLNHFRSSEMYLIEAEAKYFTSDETGAQQALIALNKDSGRDPSYTNIKTGASLLSEIKTYREIELWGEGFDWFDLKRWGDNVSRANYANGGNFITTLDVNYGPAEKNNWVWKIPEKETDYNKLILAPTN